MYPPEIVEPMENELVSRGFDALKSSQDVDNVLAKEGTTLIVVNSVCGCAAGSARPGVVFSLENAKRPDHLTTVFAGVDREAVDQARNYMLPYPPSSPSIALFKDGKLVHVVERHHIEGRTHDMIASHLKMVYDEYC
jgi:putative YphP/YqiW family bacilliredoxin